MASRRFPPQNDGLAPLRLLPAARRMHCLSAWAGLYGLSRWEAGDKSGWIGGRERAFFDEFQRRWRHESCPLHTKRRTGGGQAGSFLSALGTIRMRCPHRPACLQVNSLRPFVREPDQASGRRRSVFAIPDNRSAFGLRAQLHGVRASSADLRTGNRSAPTQSPSGRRRGHPARASAITATHLSSIAIGVGSALMPSVVRQGWALVKCSA